MSPANVLGLMAWLLSSPVLAQSPIIRVDQGHMQIGDKATSRIEYSVSAGSEIVVDLNDYEFTLWPASEPPPDTIAVIISDDQQYNVALIAGKSRYTLSSKSMIPRADSAPFGGFIAGQQLMLAIGKRRDDADAGEDVLRVHWLSLVNVI